MKTKGGKFIIFSILLLFILAAQGQSDKNSNYHPEPIPSLVNWFLSTGKWDTDPQIFVTEYGKGKDTVVMLHGGWGAEHSGMISAVKGLDKKYCFIFYDQRGSLRSPFPDSLITFQTHVDDLERLRRELKLDRMTIVGHSMGAVLASAYASTYPDRIKKLVLLAPAFLKQPFPEEDQQIKHQGYLKSMEFRNRPEVLWELEKYGLNRKSQPLSSKEMTAKSRIDFAGLMLYDVLKWNQLDNGKGLYKSEVYKLTESTYPEEGWNYYQVFGKSRYPIYVMVGSHDWLDFGGAITKRWIKEVPRIQMTLIPNAGHLLWIDAPVKFQSALNSYLND
ncbi:alpha/beta fold hydrolase [Ulvibacterium sp.]|uniref:alpha/beta fold hydrolase n=1 Tax=Ulvibacterium sp. TaxID=2665914 RepID=UPI003BAC84EB